MMQRAVVYKWELAVCSILRSCTFPYFWFLLCNRDIYKKTYNLFFVHINFFIFLYYIDFQKCFRFPYLRSCQLHSHLKMHNKVQFERKLLLQGREPFRRNQIISNIIVSTALGVVYVTANGLSLIILLDKMRLNLVLAQTFIVYKQLVTITLQWLTLIT